jgi:integrase
MATRFYHTRRTDERRRQAVHWEIESEGPSGASTKDRRPSTGRSDLGAFIVSDRAGAEKQLEAYLALKHRPLWRSGDPADVMIVEVLSLYGSERAPHLAHPELVGYHLKPLVEFFGDMTCNDISGSSCGAYVAARTSGKLGRQVKACTCRRELETLSAALGYAYKQRKLIYPVAVTYPAKAPPRERWITRSEAAALVSGALGIVAVAYDVKSRKPIKWARMFRPAYHVARFILIALYTGTRHEAVLRMRWGVNSSGGWFDLDRGVMYRRGERVIETNKRRPPVPIPLNLLPHLRRWRRLTTAGPVEYAGRLILKERRGFERARNLAGLGGEVIPHVLRHTCATWMLQNGVPTREVAGFLGTSENVIEKVYGHHHPDHFPNARRAFFGRRLAGAKREELGARKCLI